LCRERRVEESASERRRKRLQRSSHLDDKTDREDDPGNLLPVETPKTWRSAFLTVRDEGSWVEEEGEDEEDVEEFGGEEEKVKTAE